MPADRLCLTFEDKAQRRITIKANVQAGLGPANGELSAMIEKWTALSQCQLVSAELAQEIDISGLINPVADDSGNHDSVDDQVVLSFRREDEGGFARVTVPAPVDGILETSGPFTGANVDPGTVPMTEFLNTALSAAVAGEILRAAGGLQVDFHKGWRKGTKHS